MDIIVLEGLPNKGKTETIGLAYETVKNNGGIPTNKTQVGNDPRDFEDILTNYKNKKIAFYSAGDDSTKLAAAIWKYGSANCDLMICALSTGTPKIRANKAINSHNSTRLAKSITTNTNQYQTVNTGDSQIIFSLI